MRKIAAQQPKYIGFQNGQDSSLYTHNLQARASSVKTPVAVETSFSRIGGTVANILRTSQQTASPTNAVCPTGYRGVSNGTATTDATASVIGAAANCAVCSDTSSGNPQGVTIPCGIFINPPSNAPGTSTARCCENDPGIKFTNTAELIRQDGQQATLRQSFGLPSKLQGLRGPIITSK